MIEWFAVFFILSQAPDQMPVIVHSLELFHPGYSTKAECESSATTRLMELTRDSPLSQMDGRHERRFVCTPGIPK